MNPDRRKLLRNGLLAAGAAAGLAGGQQLLSRALGETTPADAEAKEPVKESAAPCCSSGPALTHDHQVVFLNSAGQAKSRKEVCDESRLGIKGRKWVMVIDLAKCDGCGHCMEGCEKMHFIPPGRKWLKVLRQKDSQNSAPYFMPQPCFHCDNPPCTKVCPVDATYKRSDGLVLVDNDRCIGCRFCMAACPYSVRVFNWGHPNETPEVQALPYSPESGVPRRVGTVEKCDWCPDMARVGKLPACAAVCPMGVIYFGDQNEDAVTNGLGETVRLTKLLKDNAGYRALEELGTEPRLYYLPPKNRSYPGPAEGAKK